MGDLEPGWLSVEIGSVKLEIANWTVGLRDSLQASIEEVGRRTSIFYTDPLLAFPYLLDNNNPAQIDQER